MSQHAHTLVVGGGISGLACAHALLAAGRTVRVLEASARPGGLVRTQEQDGFRFEEGPEALPGHARAVRGLCAELGLALHESPPAAGKRFLVLDGKLMEVPAGPEDLATSRILSFGAKVRLMAESSCARDEALDGSIADFARHRLGKEALERVVEPLVAGIHAGDPEQLSLRACFPEVVRMVEEHGSLTGALKARAAAKQAAGKSAVLGGGLIKPAGGMQRLAEALARALGPNLELGVSVRALERVAVGWRAVDDEGGEHRAGQVVLALPLAGTRALLADAAPAAAAALADMQAEGLVSVVHAWRRVYVAHALDGFGCLVPRSAGGLVLGTLFTSTIEPATAPDGHVLLRSLVGGARRPEALTLGDEELRATVLAECAAHLGTSGAPLFVRSSRHPGVIPRFDVTHPARRERLAAGLPPGLAVLGNFTRGVGLESLVSEARSVAQAVAAAS
jgi:protoporphyrinogen/coproporphyrinogen III oxidase